jgi:hypothetical protein
VSEIVIYDPTYRPGPPPRPVKPPAPARAAGFSPAWLVAAVALAAAGWMYRDRTHRPDPPPAPAPDGGFVALGREFAPRLAAALAAGFDAEADAYEAGKTASESNKALKEEFSRARQKAFADACGSAFAGVLPEGREPEDDARRKAVAARDRAFARGLRGGSR